MTRTFVTPRTGSSGRRGASAIGGTLRGDMRTLLPLGLSRRAATLGVLAALALLTGLAPLRPAAPVSAATSDTMEAKILTLVNNDRVARGLVPLRLHAGLVDLAGDRAAAMAQ